MGNHEFDQGYNDLVNRVMAPYDIDDNPYGGAAWKYLGANVKFKDTHQPALQDTWMKDFGDVQVGFVGAAPSGSASRSARRSAFRTSSESALPVAGHRPASRQGS